MSELVDRGGTSLQQVGPYSSKAKELCQFFFLTHNAPLTRSIQQSVDCWQVGGWVAQVQPHSRDWLTPVSVIIHMYVLFMCV